MRICMLAYTFYEGDNRVRRYAEALAKRGVTVDIISCRRPGHDKREYISGVNVFAIQQRSINEKHKIDYFLKIMAFLIQSCIYVTLRHLRHPYQVIHVHSVPDFEVFAALIPKVLGAKIILDIHDIVPEFYASKFNAGKDSFLSKALILVERMCCAFSDRVIISNHLWQDKITARSVTKEKCTVMLNYPDPNLFRQVIQKEKSDTFIMMYPGTLSWHQGLDLAITAFAKVRSSMPNAQLHFYGRGSEEESLKNLAKSLSMTDVIFFNGLLPLHEVAVKMASCQLGIIPKRADDFGNEAFSTKIFEFMTLGVPVLISSTKIDRYYFDESVVTFFTSGNIDELAKQMVFLYANEQVRINQAQRAEKFIQAYSWDSKKHEYFALIDALIN